MYLTQQLFWGQFSKKMSNVGLKIITELKVPSERAQQEQENVGFNFESGPSYVKLYLKMT